MKIWKAQKKPIVIGMQLNGQDDRLLKSALSLAKVLQSRVELVHCMDAPIGYSSAGEILAKSSSQVPLLQHEASQQTARSQLEAYAQSSRNDPLVQTHLGSGDPAEELCHRARELGAGLIVCGLRERAQADLLQGVSTALALAFYAPVPVLILPRSTEVDFQKPVPLLIADNLSAEASYVLESGLQLARQLASPAVYHMHVLKTNEAEIALILGEMEADCRAGRLPQDMPRTAESLQQKLLSKIESELAYRFHNSSCCKDLKERYHPLAAMGTVDKALQSILASHYTQLIVMGRHQFYSYRKLAMDQIPFQALVAFKLGLLVIPSYDEGRSQA